MTTEWPRNSSMAASSQPDLHAQTPLSSMGHFFARYCASVVCRARIDSSHAVKSSGLYRTAAPIFMNGGPFPLNRQFAMVCFEMPRYSAARVVSNSPGWAERLVGVTGARSSACLSASVNSASRKESSGTVPAGVSTRTRTAWRGADWGFRC